METIKSNIKTEFLNRLTGFMRALQYRGIKDKHVALFILAYFLAKLDKEGIIAYTNYDEKHNAFWIIVEGKEDESFEKIDNEVYEAFKEYEDEYFKIYGMFTFTEVFDYLSEKLSQNKNY